MSRVKCKLVLKADKNIAKSASAFTIVKSVNTLEFGIPGDTLSRDEVDLMLRQKAQTMQNGMLTVEFLT